MERDGGGERVPRAVAAPHFTQMRRLAAAAPNKTGKKHPGKAILAGELVSLLVGLKHIRKHTVSCDLSWQSHSVCLLLHLHVC